MGLFGLPVLTYIRTKNSTERDLINAARKEAADVLDDILTNLARKIVSEQAAAEDRGRKKQGRSSGR